MLRRTGALGFAAGPVPWIHCRRRSGGISLPTKAPSRASWTVIFVRAMCEPGSRKVMRCLLRARAARRSMPRRHHRLSVVVERGQGADRRDRVRGQHVRVGGGEITADLEALGSHCHGWCPFCVLCVLCSDFLLTFHFPLSTFEFTWPVPPLRPAHVSARTPHGARRPAPPRRAPTPRSRRSPQTTCRTVRTAARRYSRR